MSASPNVAGAVPGQCYDLRKLTVATLIQKLVLCDPEAWRIARQLVSTCAELTRMRRSRDSDWKPPQ